MSLYEDWVRTAYEKEGEVNKKLWDDFMPMEQRIYEDLLKNKTQRVEGTPKTLSEKYGMSVEFICGFLDGLNDAAGAPLKMEELAEDQALDIPLDYEDLYKKMVEYKAEHLYTLPQWNGIFSPQRQKELFTEQKRSGTVVKEAKPSRNDPCPCGSGKKYKKCCGAA